MQTQLSPKSCQPGSRSGFTLVEALIATAIVGFSFVGLYAGLVQGDNLIQNTSQNNRASEIMAEQMETIRLYTWDQLTNSGYIPLSNTISYYPTSVTNSSSQGVGIVYTELLSISNCPVTENYGADLRQVTVTVLWSSATGNHQRQMTTLVSHYGMQNYVNTGN